MPVAEPILSGDTYFCTANGPQMVTKMKATPSTARETMSTMPLPANAPISEPAATTTAAASSIVLGPNFFASAPVGSASTMPTNVKIDMSHDADEASMSIFTMISPMTTGTLY